jgi:hypothetical protein
MDNPPLQITAVTLRRSGSRGFSPVYEVTLRADGSADWNGERFVLRIGRFRGQFDVRNFAKLAMFVERAGFFGWKDEYSGGGTDAPDYELAVAAGDADEAGSAERHRRTPDFWVIATVVDGLAAAIEWRAGSSTGLCGQWTATLTSFGIMGPLLSVHRVCTFPTGGYKVELRRHEPQSGAERTLLLDRVVTAPSNPTADVVTEVAVSYEERNPSLSE